MDFSKVIKAHLKRKNWSQQKLADKSGIGKSAISLIVNGKSNSVSLITLERLSVALSVPMWRLVKEAKEVENDNTEN